MYCSARGMRYCETMLALLRPRSLGPLVALLLCQCAPEGSVTSTSGGDVETAASALTTPTGANWIVLPRPPARISSVFTDAFAAPFVASASGASATVSTTVKTQGTSSLAVTLAAAGSSYGAAIPVTQAAFAGNGQTELSFAFNAGAAVHAGIADLQVAVDDGDPLTPLTWVPVKPLLVGTGAVAASTWYRATVPMSTLNPAGGIIRGLLFRNGGTLANVGFYLDDVRFSWTDAAPTERLVYGDAPGTDFVVSGWSVTSATDPFRTTGTNALRANYTAAWGGFALVYNWGLPAFATNAFTHVSFDISAGTGTPPAAMSSIQVGVDGSTTRPLLPYIPGGFKANTWHHVTIPMSDLVTSTTPYRMVMFPSSSTSTYAYYVDNVRFEIDHAPPALLAPFTPPGGGGDPDTFAVGEIDVETRVKTAEDRKPISPLLYGFNGMSGEAPADVVSGITFIRRGGDRVNAYNWETNVSNGGQNNNFSNDMYLASGLANPNAPAGTDLDAITKNRAAGRATMTPFVLNDYVAGPVAANIPYDTVGFNRDAYFRRNYVVKPTALAATPDLNDGKVYQDEYLQYLRSKFAQDILAPGPTQVMVAIDNEPDLWHWAFPMLQAGSGAPLNGPSGRQVGTTVTPEDFTARVIAFAKRVKQLAPNAHIIGPSHYGFDGFTSWNQFLPQFSSAGHWYMDDFLTAIKNESTLTGTRLLDTFDFHWYPQGVINGTPVWGLNQATRAMTQAEIDAVTQGPRSYWDTEYNENSWVTSQWHLNGPAYIISRLQSRIATNYPGTNLAVSEYFPGGLNHIASGLATVDSLGVFARMGISLAALWPVSGPSDMRYAYGGIKLLRNANGAGLRFDSTLVRVEHPEKVQSSVYAANDAADHVAVIVINKTNAVRRFGLRTFHGQRLGKVDTYRIDAANASPVYAGQTALTKNNAYAYAAPPMSASLLVFRTP